MSHSSERAVWFIMPITRYVFAALLLILGLTGESVWSLLVSPISFLFLDFVGEKIAVKRDKALILLVTRLTALIISVVLFSLILIVDDLIQKTKCDTEMNCVAVITVEPE